MAGKQTGKIKTHIKILMPIGDDESIKEEIQKCLRETQDISQIEVERLEFEIELHKNYVSYSK
ncbi:MAG: hypothetical protein NRZ51_04570 [Bacillus paranthracis]|nr:MAG: hypothetical protein NRZ50_15300 [Bacillus paranthracis]WAI32621.1 MAG: hypothetical protein NRZ52_27975 [Bacillus paranthracis]WAI39237.1 MAG: hypothetical protein NRZ51_04570 [Bacillus paranthracis]